MWEVIKILYRSREKDVIVLNLTIMYTHSDKVIHEMHLAM